MQPQSVSGMNCPVCEKFIPIEIGQLLFNGGIMCPYCSLSLTVNHNQSKDAMRILQKVNDAAVNVKRASVFNR